MFGDIVFTFRTNALVAAVKSSDSDTVHAAIDTGSEAVARTTGDALEAILYAAAFGKETVYLTVDQSIALQETQIVTLEQFVGALVEG